MIHKWDPHILIVVVICIARPPRNHQLALVLALVGLVVSYGSNPVEFVVNRVTMAEQRCRGPDSLAIVGL